jgi:gliding motility-associated-like protein
MLGLYQISVINTARRSLTSIAAVMVIAASCLITLFSPHAHGQSPGPQDCIEAIPICGTSYVNNAIYTGVGSIPNEINALNSCLLTGERNDAWYIINIASNGSLSFSIIPNTPSENYDWAVYDLTSSDCSDIFSNPALEVSCNYNSNPGATGPNGLMGAQNEPVIPVSAGQTFVINVSSFSAVNQSGYTIDLSSSTASVTDNAIPTISSVNSLNCGASSIRVVFSENVLCSTVQPSDFTLTGPGGPYVITGVTSNECGLGASSARTFDLSVSPSITTSGAFTFDLVGAVDDRCGNQNITGQSFPIQIAPLSVSISKNDVTCFGGNNGSATATVTGSSGPFTYQWSPSGGSNASAQFLTAGTYAVTVTSQAGCSATASVTISQPSVGMTASVTTTPANGCAANGSASVAVQNGQPPFTYSWWPTGGNGSTANNLTAGGYMVTITDANQCVLNYFLNVPSVNGPSAAITAQTDVTCHGGNDGSATVTVNGAPGPFIYQWSPAGGNGATANGLSAGTYTVVVTINAGCTVSATTTISEPLAPLVLTGNATHTTCGQTNGTVSVSASGGTPGYNYQWQPSVTTGTSATSLAAGSYSVTVTDNNGCTESTQVTVNASTTPLVSLSGIVNVTCSGSNNGSVSIIVTGGQSPYSYNWSNGQTTQNISSLGPGNYTVTVSDVNGCAGTLSATVTSPSVLNLSAPVITNVPCHGESTGQIAFTAAGGVAPYSWSWSGGLTGNGSVTNVPAGSYTVTVTDMNGCTAGSSAVISEPMTSLNNISTVVQPACGQNNGSVSLSVTGGTLPYTFSWSPNVSSGNTANNLSAGSYEVTITDGNGCSLVVTEQLQSSNSPSITVDLVTDVECHGENTGEIQTTITGGVPPYQVQWSNGAGTTGIQNLQAGVYIITVTDQDGCVAVEQVTISEPDPLTIQLSGDQLICIGETAMINSQVSGGVPPYIYQWSTGQVTPDVTVNPVSSGSYILAITDSNGCEQISEPFNISLHPPLTLAINTPDTVCAGTEVLVSLQPGGGDGNYTISWSNGMSGLNNVILPTSSMMIHFIVSDGCATPDLTDSVHITVIDPPSVIFDLDIDSGCQPLPVTFNIPGGPMPGYIYEWNFGDGEVSGTPEPTHVYSAHGLFTPTLIVTANVAGSCSNTYIYPDQIEVYQLPLASFYFEPSDPTLNFPTVEFHDQSINAVSWNWDMGDGSGTSGLKDPIYTYSDTGNYIVTLIVESINGCIDTVQGVVNVRDEIQIFIPNAFTPDDSGNNDQFMVYGVGFTTYSMKIYDRWGKLVFSGNNSMSGWDGRSAETGKRMAQGIYIYHVVVTDNDGFQHSRMGKVTLIR